MVLMQCHCENNVQFKYQLVTLGPVYGRVVIMLCYTHFISHKAVPLPTHKQGQMVTLVSFNIKSEFRAVKKYIKIKKEYIFVCK